MRTRLPAELLATDVGQRADAILRSCVHCGFCTATCPTYQVLGDELDGPRGRIWLIKEMLERGEAGRDTRTHLDRCLTCRSCETTCPSGVAYGELLEIGRKEVERLAPRTIVARGFRRTLIGLFSRPALLRWPLVLGQWLAPVLPRVLREKVPPRTSVLVPGTLLGGVKNRSVILLAGCVQSVATPSTNRAARSVLHRLGVQAVEASGAGCCGALPHHLAEEDAARDMARRNIDAWTPLLDEGAEALVMTASGCGVEVREYDRLLASDAAYASRAERIARATMDLSEFVERELGAEAGRTEPGTHAVERSSSEDQHEVWSTLRSRLAGRRVAWHAPCTLQHGQQADGCVERILDALDVERVAVGDPHLCCGSAGTYSILQSTLSRELRSRKLEHLHSHGPQEIVTANVGCQLHLAAGTETPVRHWIELLAEALVTDSETA